MERCRSCFLVLWLRENLWRKQEMRLMILATVLVSLLLMVACSDPAADKSKAVTSSATAPTSPTTSQGEKYRITPQNSKIEFVASKVVGSQSGSFKDFSGEIDYTGKPETSRVNVTINMGSVETDAEGLTQHLKTPDFFDVAKFPQSTFTSTEVKAGGDKGASHTISGNFQLHGVTKLISFPATITVAPDGVSVESTFSINRKDFGITYTGMADNAIRDEVVMTLHIKATK